MVKRSLEEEDTGILGFFNEFRKAEERDIERGYYTYGEGVRRPLDFPESFLIRMMLRYSINPYDEKERLKFSLK